MCLWYLTVTLVQVFNNHNLIVSTIWLSNLCCSYLSKKFYIMVQIYSSLSKWQVIQFSYLGETAVNNLPHMIYNGIVTTNWVMYEDAQYVFANG